MRQPAENTARHEETQDRGSGEETSHGGWKFSSTELSTTAPVRVPSTVPPAVAGLSPALTACQATRPVPMPILGASQRDPIYEFDEGKPCRERAPDGKGRQPTRSTLVSGFPLCAAYKSHSEPLDQVIKCKGGINKCAGRLAKCLGRSRPKDPSLMSQRRNWHPVKYVMAAGLD